MIGSTILRIGWDDRESYHQYGIYLGNEKIGFIEINREEDAIILFNIEIKEEHRKKGYFLDCLKQIEERGKSEGGHYMIIQWLTLPDKIFSLEKRGFRGLTKDEHIKFRIPTKSNDGQEVSVIKEI